MWVTVSEVGLVVGFETAEKNIKEILSSLIKAGSAANSQLSLSKLYKVSKEINLNY